MAVLAAAACGAVGDSALVLSPGVIGEFLPLPKSAEGIAAAAKQLASDEAALVAAARGMMTTDTIHKLAGRSLSLGGRTLPLTGRGQGAPMIRPRMATILGLIPTHAPLTVDTLEQSLPAGRDGKLEYLHGRGPLRTT